MGCMFCLQVEGLIVGKGGGGAGGRGGGVLLPAVHG